LLFVSYPPSALADLDFRNINTLWASVLVDTLQHLGVSIAIICPGSRSTPLAVAFAQAPHIEAISILDERSAAFFALGHAKRTGRPAALVCTSGTAAANFYPAVIEARESRVPLLILTADRPPELRDCHSGQTIDQVKLYGNYPNWQAEIAIPSSQPTQLAYLQQTITYAWERTITPTAGSVHLNLPFCDPLPPISQPEIQALATTLTDFPPPSIPALSQLSITQWSIPTAWQTSSGLIIAGVAQPPDPLAYAQAIGQISQALGWPVLAEGLSPLRNYADLNPYLVSSYDLILRNTAVLPSLIPEVIIQIGDLPTSKELRQWLSQIRPRTWIIETSEQNMNSLHLNASYQRMPVTEVAQHFQDRPPATISNYGQNWLALDQKTRQSIDRTMNQLKGLCECKIPWLLSQSLPPATIVFIANSMPIRDMEFFWRPNNQQYRPVGNRGANGIDGTLSTALGVAHHSTQPVILITGDLSLLHDTNGLLLRQQFQGSLTILLINNNGGGIFTMLPIAKFDPPFTEFFSTPQNVNFSILCQAYQICHQKITSWSEFQPQLAHINKPGIRVWEIKTSAQQDSEWRRTNLSQLCHLS
jgi:2-succinyl-5-enolpyruvyl-6-hydroxy-3-cyclohexene-1-carboxylate synthase